MKRKKRNPTIWKDALSGEDFKTFNQSFLYAWIRDSRMLYLGQSRNGLARIFQHHVIGVMDDVLPDDEFCFLPVPVEDLNKEERRWIEYYTPLYNVFHNPVPFKSPKIPRMSQEQKAALEDIILLETSTPEEVVAAADKLRGKPPKLFGKYCAYDCTCPGCNRDRAAALR